MMKFPWPIGCSKKELLKTDFLSRQTKVRIIKTKKTGDILQSGSNTTNTTAISSLRNKERAKPAIGVTMSFDPGIYFSEKLFEVF